MPVAFTQVGQSILELFACRHSYTSPTGTVALAIGNVDILIYGSHCDVMWGSVMAKSPDEKTVQIKVSPALKKEIHLSALERDETVRTFILKALKDRGIAVSDGDLVDRRKAVIR